MTALTLQQIDGAFSVELPPEAVELLQARAGDTLQLVPTPDGAFRLSARSAEFEADFQRGMAFFERYRETFEALAK